MTLRLPAPAKTPSVLTNGQHVLWLGDPDKTQRPAQIIAFIDTETPVIQLDTGQSMAVKRDQLRVP